MPIDYKVRRLKLYNSAKHIFKKTDENTYPLISNIVLIT